MTAWLLINSLVTAPSQALAGLVLMALGLPFYWYWSRAAARSTMVAAVLSLIVAGPCRPVRRPRPMAPADRPAPRTDANSMAAHAELLEKAKAGRIDVYFVGDSITRRWGATDYPELLANWRANFHGWNAANFGWGADRTQNILWRLENGELDGVNPKVIVVLAGTNNVGSEPGDEDKVADITRGLEAIRDVCRRKAPGGDDHPDRDLPAQRQHGRDARDRSHQPEPGGAWPTACGCAT